MSHRAQYSTEPVQAPAKYPLPRRRKGASYFKNVVPGLRRAEHGQADVFVELLENHFHCHSALDGFGSDFILGELYAHQVSGYPCSFLQFHYCRDKRYFAAKRRRWGAVHDSEGVQSTATAALDPFGVPRRSIPGTGKCRGDKSTPGRTQCIAGAIVRRLCIFPSKSRTQAGESVG